MKKIFTMAIIAIFTISCSKDSEPIPVNNVNPEILLKKAIVTENEESVTINYTYEGNKLSGVSFSDGRSIKYEYSNEKVINIKDYLNNQLVKNQDLLYYDGIAMIKEITSTIHSEETTLNERSTFEFDINRNIVIRTFRLNTIGEPYLYLKKVLFMNGINVSSVNIYEGSSSTAQPITYTYDVKNNPFRNIHSNKYIVMANQKGGANNIISYHWSKLGEDESATVAYTYNSHDFPLTSTETNSSGATITTQYFYD